MEFEAFLQVPDRFDVSGHTRWQLVRSCASGLVMLNPRPGSSDMAVHYPAGSYEPFFNRSSTTSLRKTILLAARLLLLRYRASLILADNVKPRCQHSVLEIGCAGGELLNFLHCTTGIPLDNLAGVEPDTAAAAHGRKVFRLTVTAALHNEYKGLFDRIVVWHSLEHIHALHETLHRLEQLLDPDGVLVIALPNPECHEAKQYRENWIAWDAPRHLYHFVPGTLEKLLEQHNLHVVKRLPYMPDTVYNALFSEKLRCKRSGKAFGLFSASTALCRALLALQREIIWPETGSSVIYFARKQQSTTPCR